MGVIPSLYPEAFEEENKQDKAKFIRYKEEVANEDDIVKDTHLFSNAIIDNYLDNHEPHCHQKFVHKNDELTEDVDYYQKWSQHLN